MRIVPAAKRFDFAWAGLGMSLRHFGSCILKSVFERKIKLANT